MLLNTINSWISFLDINHYSFYKLICYNFVRPLSVWQNVMLHIWCGLSYWQQQWMWTQSLPSCIIMCRFSDEAAVKHFSHSEHLYLLSPVWRDMCVSRLYLRLVAKLQRSQWKGSFDVSAVKTLKSHSEIKLFWTEAYYSYCHNNKSTLYWVKWFQVSDQQALDQHVYWTM